MKQAIGDGPMVLRLPSFHLVASVAPVTGDLRPGSGTWPKRNWELVTVVRARSHPASRCLQITDRVSHLIMNNNEQRGGTIPTPLPPIDACKYIRPIPTDMPMHDPFTRPRSRSCFVTPRVPGGWSRHIQGACRSSLDMSLWAGVPMHVPDVMSMSSGRKLCVRVPSPQLWPDGWRQH